jgi:hypothetical protein
VFQRPKIARNLTLWSSRKNAAQMYQLLSKPQIRNHLSKRHVVSELPNHKLDDHRAAHAHPIARAMNHPLQIAARIKAL